MELALIFVLELCGLVLGLALARVAFASTPDLAVRRVLSALERATRAFLARALARVASAAALLSALVLSLGFASAQGHAAVMSVSGLSLGAALASLAGLGAGWLGSRTAMAVIVGAGGRFDWAVGAAFRGAGATAIFAQALAVAGALALLGGGYWLGHAPGVPAGELSASAVLGLPGYALGSCLAALVLHRTAGAYAAAARGGVLRGVLLDAEVARHETKNPALVSSLVGERLEHATAVARLFATSALAAVAAVELAIGLQAKGALETRVIAFPLLLWAFGLVANGAGLLVARSLEAQGASPALARGQLTAGTVLLVGMLGGGAWLFPDSWTWLAGAGAAGSLAGAFAPYGMVRAFARRRGPMREALDGLGVGAGWAQASAFGFGLAHAAFGLAVLALAGVAAERLGGASGIPGGEQLALMLAAFGALAWSPYALAVEAGSGVAETARGVAALAGADAEAQSRIQRLADSSQVASAVARAHLGLADGLAVLAAALALTTASIQSPLGALVWALGVLGVVLVIAAAGLALTRFTRGAREVAVEVERQLGGSGLNGPPEARSPSYRSCEELAGRVALSGAGSEVGSLLAGPVLLGIATRLVYRGSGPRLAAEALATLVAGAAVTALGVALAVDGARAVLAGARRANRPDGDQRAHAAAVTGSALAEILGSAAGPAACTAALLTASLALLLRIFLP
jgi:K(+)-stimulated pyrophosphate-energized sodium pump